MSKIKQNTEIKILHVFECSFQRTLFYHLVAKEVLLQFYCISLITVVFSAVTSLLDTNRAKSDEDSQVDRVSSRDQMQMQQPVAKTQYIKDYLNTST